MEFRSRSLPDTLELAVSAGRAAGVTRVSDVTAFGVPGIPVFQATRPRSRSLTVSQGKGFLPTAAIIGALLESTELWSAESLVMPGDIRPLADLPEQDIRIWSGDRDRLEIDLDRAHPRAWLRGMNLSSGEPCPMPWGLVSLDLTQRSPEHAANSNGLASGNSRAEALVSGVAELLEHHFAERFRRLSRAGRRALQIGLATIDDKTIQRLLACVDRAGFEVRAWSVGDDFPVPAFEVVLLESGKHLDDITPVVGNGCHPDARVAFVRALLEAVQTRATYVAGARDDLTVEGYLSRQSGNIGILLNTFAFNDGPLDWRNIPSSDCRDSEGCLDFLLENVGRITSLPVVAYDHPAPWPGLHISHVLAPGLMDGYRRTEPVRERADNTPGRALSVNTRPLTDCHAVLFAGPSIAGLSIPNGIEVRPPAMCGDLAALLADPPAAVGLIDGFFKLAPTVWHNEILSLLALGVRVLGGASLGALRAAELERFGMEGVGAIFEAYRNGAMVRDDAVMLVHAPAELGYAPLSMPLVDAEHILLNLELPQASLRMMQRIVRTTPYETRDWLSCLQQYRARTGSEFPVSLEELEAAPSLKVTDALMLVEELAQTSALRREVSAMPPLTCYFRTMLATSAPEFAASLT